MIRVLLAAVALAAFPLGSRGEEASVRLAVEPMPPPKPALKYQLLPEVRELKPGNAAPNYLKCFMEQRQFFYTKEAAADRADYQAMPLAKLPLDKVRGYGGGVARQADWAARLNTADWQTLERFQSGGVDKLVDEMGPFQDLAAALHVRFRADVAERKFDDAIRSAKTIFALARHLGEHSTEVADLVGLWTVRLGLGAVAEMVEQPGCPNLYWALTDLPDPLVDLRKGVQGDRSRVAADLRLLRDDAPMTEPELAAFVRQWSGMMGFTREQAGRPPRSERARLQTRVKDSARVSDARRRLVEAGSPANLVETFPPTQVILLDEKRDYEIQRDERIKLLRIPLWQNALAETTEEGPDDEGLFAALLPRINRLRSGQARVAQQIALLRHVEALRLYAAAHDGKLPATLSEIPVPLPADPVTGKPFLYAVDGATAHIRGSALPGEVRNAEGGVHYEVTLRK